MNFTRENLVQIWGVLNGLAQEKTTAKGAYGIAKNKRIVETEVKSIEEAQKNQQLPEGIEEYEQKRLGLCEKFCDKDEEGKPVVNGNTFVIVKERPAFDTELLKLQEEFKEPLSTRQKQDLEFQDFLKEEVNVDFHQIKIDDLPNNVTGQQVEVLGDIIIE